MQITITVEELQAFEDKCRGWTRTTAEKIAQVVPTRQDFATMRGTRDIETIRQELAKVEAANPFPVLIPRA